MTQRLRYTLRWQILSFLLFEAIWGAELTSLQVPVNINHEKGVFKGQLSIALGGTLNKAKVEWNGTIRNTASHRLFRVVFCVKAFDTAERHIMPGGNECLLSMWGSDWDPGTPLTFSGKQNIKIADDKTPVQVQRFVVEAAEVLDLAPNVRQLNVRCPLIWSAAIRVFSDKKFRPTVMDKDSFTATFSYDGGRIDGYGPAKQMLKSFTNANTAFLGPTWESFRIDSASLYLREETIGECTAEVKMSFAGFGKPFLGTLGWYAVDSNFNFEKVILDQLDVQSKAAANADLDRAISQLPTVSPKANEMAQPQLTITSDPAGAEIEIDGEFIGNTPTTVTVKQGKVFVKVKRGGFKHWERALTLNPGDKRTLSAEFVRE